MIRQDQVGERGGLIKKAAETDDVRNLAERLAQGRVDGAQEERARDADAGEPLADRLVVDLDPGAGMTIVESARAALIVAARLAEDGMIPIAQTSGSKGIQVYAAIAPTRSKTAWSYVKQLNASLHKAQPDFFVSTMSIDQRTGRIYVDYNQNLAARNTIAPYSMRGRENPAIATPVSWEELGRVGGPDDLRFAPEEVLARVAEYGDLAHDLLTSNAPPLPEEA